MWPNSEETQQLLREAGTGDQQAINALLEKHRNSLRQLIQLRLDRAVSRRVDASDVVQDVLLEASNRLGQFIEDGRMPFHLWLRQLAKDRMIDMHRRHRGAQRRSVDRERSLEASRQVDDSLRGMMVQLVDPELTPAAASLRRELEDRFLAALDQLPEDDRDILLMRHYEQLGNSEVAQALGLSEPAAGMRHLRALRRLRSMLATDEAGEADFTDQA
ncbi:MAG: sigma-70 family RNA polymerase sigma factor [Planctomycetaceae bacterium]|nr:sigma-70 family RNA polymerase sigma factor [Planctomycetaceae bacterium]